MHAEINYRDNNREYIIRESGTFCGNFFLLYAVKKENLSILGKVFKMSFWNNVLVSIICHLKICGEDVPKLEPTRRLNFSNLDKSIQKLRKIYREKPEWFEVPDFAQKVY